MRGVRTDRMRSVIVVGAGAGGLAAACDLARQGVAVQVFESANTVGGRIHQQRVDGQPIDSGPTVLTMRWVFDDLLAACGETLEDEDLRLLPLDVLARHAWSADERLDLFADPRRSTEAIGELSGPAEARRFEAFCAEARRIYHHLEAAYIRTERPSLLSMTTDLGPSGMLALTGLGPFASLWKSLGRHFHDPRLRQLFGRYATYCGGSPWLAPATLMLIAYVEMRGVWVAQGGMQALANRLARSAVRQGVSIECSQPVSEILVDQGKAVGIRLSDGRCHHADAVVFNGEVGALVTGRLGASAARAVTVQDVGTRSASALTVALRARVEGFELDYHNVFFQPDYRSEFTDLFEQGRLPTRPTLYVCAQDRVPGGRNTGDSGGPLEESGERIFGLINAPATTTDVALRQEDIERCLNSAFSHLERCGLRLTTVSSGQAITTPAAFAQRFPGSAGALYGMAPHGWMSSFRRPSARTRLPGLFLAGGSAHPGAGVPMATLSGRVAAATVMAHLDSTRRSSRVRISGGMSMV